MEPVLPSHRIPPFQLPPDGSTHLGGVGTGGRAPNMVATPLTWWAQVDEHHAVEQSGSKREAVHASRTMTKEARVLTQVCYFCAQLQPPVRGAHTFIDCVKRKRAGKREFQPDAFATLTASLQARNGRPAPTPSPDAHPHLSSLPLTPIPLLQPLPDALSSLSPT
eukprot:7388994-Prymnesium_polylepis.1